MKSCIPIDYRPLLSVKDTEKAIERLRDFFQYTLQNTVNLHRVSAPLFVEKNTGLNDNLSGTERAVGFDIPILGVNCEIVHSLAKWKRMALGKYGYKPGEGIYTNMNAIRRDEQSLDNLHSVYVDQWDWEKIIDKSERTREFLEKTVCEIYSVIYESSKFIEQLYPILESFLTDKVKFVTAQELEDMYPCLTSVERENKYAKKYGTIFIIGIGDKLNSGNPHDLRAPDYDDWSLNGDLLVWYPILNRAIELSSMGIRVDAAALNSQLDKANVVVRTAYHNAIINNEYPLTIGGGIGQSRVCQVLLHKAHIGEVQCSIWDNETIAECKSKSIELL